MSANVKWYENALLAEVEVESDELLLNLAFQIEAKTKVAINELDLIDTGFMVNSVYAANHKVSGYGYTDPSGRYVNREGYEVWRISAPEIVPNKGEAVVHVAAEYFLRWELAYNILYNALMEAVAEMRGK